MIYYIIEASNQIKIVLEAICRCDANLMTAEATVDFLFEDINKSHSYYNSRIQKAINQRVQELYTKTLVIIQYLHNTT